MVYLKALERRESPLLTVAVTFGFVRTYIYASDFTQVELAVPERQVLDNKLRVLGYEPDSSAQKSAKQAVTETDQQWLRPE